jgi:hypothetical protein
MQSASARFYTQAISRTRAALPGGVLWTSIIIFLLTLALSKSTVTAQWVGGIEVVPLVALSGAIVMGLLALTPIRWAAGLAIGMVLGPIVAGYAAWPVLHSTHPTDALGMELIHVWWVRIVTGLAVNDSSFGLYLISWLMWVTGGWLAWCVLRWRRPLLGLIPGAAAFATTLLNIPRDQNGYVLAILVLTLALLLWSNYMNSIANATRARVKLTGDARWDFWESGLVAMAALIVLAIMLPPLSTVDRSVDIESSAFTSWAQLLQTLNHPGTSGLAAGAGRGTTGFSPDVLLNSSLKRNRDVVFAYTVSGDFVGRPYFRGVNETRLSGGAWRYANDNGSLVIQWQKTQVPQYAEDYSKLAYAGFNVRMISPPVGNADILFYPGRFYKVNRESQGVESMAPPPTSAGPLVNIDRLASVSPRTSNGTYVATVEFSTATDTDLQAAGTAYPFWVSDYQGIPTQYRDLKLINKIHALALQIVQDANAQNPYDEARAIEAYLRSSKFSYTLDVQQPPAGIDPLENFLFNTHKGYCEFFATAMGDMLRTLGIPTRLASGYGPGTFDTTINSFVVRSDDAHTWVEVYFPTYGWIEFEPTNDNVYFPIQRGASGSNICLRDLLCSDSGVPSGTTVGVPNTRPQSGGPNVSSQAPGGGGAGFLKIPDPGTLTKIIGIVLALLLVLLAAVARYLRPRTVMGVWRRTLVLARLAGADQRTGETPYELGRRLAWSFPEASEHVRSLANGFVIAAYAPPDVAHSARSSVMESWSALRPLLLRRAFSRFRPSRV